MVSLRFVKISILNILLISLISELLNSARLSQNSVPILPQSHELNVVCHSGRTSVVNHDEDALASQHANEMNNIAYFNDFFLDLTPHSSVARTFTYVSIIEMGTQ